MTVVAIVVTVCLGLAATLTVARMLLGPSVLDRVVALDMLVAIIVCGLAASAAYTRDSTVVPVLVVVALLGFLGSSAIAGFLGRSGGR
jgi:multicomponent Na+:H+ antiporter subunit F